MVQITSDIELSGAGCTTAITPNQLVQSSSENDICAASFKPSTIVR
ncbi:NTP-binding protein [Pseudomonas aeruginosa]|nr:NTP-binding protein [Pseudomonas aeruginosa]